MNYAHRIGIGTAQSLCRLGYMLDCVGFDVWQRQAISLFIKTYRLGTGGKVARVWGWCNSPPATAEVKNQWSYTSVPLISWWCAQGQLHLFHLYAQSDGSGVTVLLLLLNVQLVRASFVLPLNIMKLTVTNKTPIIVRIVNVLCVVCLSVHLYTKAPQVKLYVLNIHRVEVLTVTKLRIQDFWDVMQCLWIFYVLKDHCTFIVKVR
jgi:hypothetical protein